MEKWLFSFLLALGIIALLMCLCWICCEIAWAIEVKKAKNIRRQLDFREKSLNLVYCALILRVYDGTYNPPTCYDSWYEYFLLPFDEKGKKKYKDIRDVWVQPSEYDMLLQYVKENKDEEDFLLWGLRQGIYLSRFADFT